MKKRLCVLQVTPSKPNKDHVLYFKDKEKCDFYFVTHDEDNPEALKYCPNTKWCDTRNALAELVPKDYEYYAFIDYDYILRPQRGLQPLEQIIEDLELNPAVLTYYPGNNLETPYASDESYFNSRDYSCIPFTHFGLKVVHHSLMKWFFPLCTNFYVDVDSCHMFNIQEIPFLKNVICSHKMIYDNGNSDKNAVYNQDGAYSKYRMDQMWKWIRPSFKMNKIIDFNTNSDRQRNDSLVVKNVFVDLMRNKNITPESSPREIQYFNEKRISKVFDLEHEFFINKNKTLEEQFTKVNDELTNKVEEYIRENVTYKSLKSKDNPWIDIVKNINNKFSDYRNITTNECVEIFQKMENNDALFINNSKIDPLLNEYLKGKRVAFVGPAPYLMGLGKGKEIDEYDIVVRIQHDIQNLSDYGSKTDIIQSCLNSNYGPPIVNHLNSIDKKNHPKFIICNDTVSQQRSDGSWMNPLEAYGEVFKSFDIPLVTLKNDDNTWDRWALYWEIYAKSHIEKHSNKYTMYSENFNSGYGALNFLLRYPIKELTVFGVDFYNTGLPQTNEEKYNSLYIKTYGDEGTHLGPDKVLHDQLSQMMHCRNVLMKDKRFKMDPIVAEKLLSDDLSKRLNMFSKLPKFKNNTQ